MKLRFERGALADLDEIFAYIAADNPVAAARLVARIESRRDANCRYALYRGSDAQARLSQISGRQLFDGVYEIGADEVVIHYVRHGARLRPWEGEQT